MEYEILARQYTKNYMRRYENAIKNNKEKACLIGSEKEYRIIGRESILTKISDTDIVFHYCLYPRYIEGDKTINLRVEAFLKEMAESEDVVSIYQAAGYVFSQDYLMENFENLPFLINVEKIVPLLKKDIVILGDKMKEYNEGEFKFYNIYKMIHKMMKNSASFKWCQCCRYVFSDVLAIGTWQGKEVSDNESGKVCQ